MTTTAFASDTALPPFPAPWRRPAPTGSPIRVAVARVTDPLCPWAYSFEPVLRTLESRYGDQLEFRTLLIGLVTTVEESLMRGSSSEGRALTALRFRRFGMPITPHVRERVIVSAPACRLVKAAGLTGPEPADALLCALRRTANSDDADRDTAPTLIFTAADGRQAIVPGFPYEAHDVALMNLEPRLVRLPVPDLGALLETYPGGLTSHEVTRVLADTTAPVDRATTEVELTGLVAAGRARRRALGDDALWAAVP